MGAGATIRPMAWQYQSGEEVKAGDRILYAGEPGSIDFVALPGEPEHAWYVEQFGGGCMILTAQFGSIFTSEPQNDEDLEFVSRAQPLG